MGNAPGEDAVVHAGFPSDHAEQRRIGGFALEGQAHDTAADMGKGITLLVFIDLFGFHDEALGGRVLGMQKHLGDRAVLDDHTGIHHRHTVAHAADHIHFMGDQHDGQVQFAVDLRQQVQHRGGGLRVEGAGGFVAEQDFRLGGQGAGNADTLLLAAGQLGRVLLGVVGQADALQQLGDALLDGAGRQLAGQLQRQGDIVGDGFRGQQIEVLEDHPDLLAETAQTVGIQGGDVFAVDIDAPAGRLFQAVDEAQQSTFASAGMADDAKHFAAGDIQVGGLQGGDVAAIDAIRLMDVVKVDHSLNLLGLAVCRIGIKER